MHYIDPRRFLEYSFHQPIADVRSPSEFLSGHIPGAFNLPLFNDDERKKVGTLYKNSGREASVLLGLEITGPRLSGYVKEARKIAREKEILVHCWRGGMRSKGMAWPLDTAGFNVSVLEGGYKAYRRFIRQQLGGPFHLRVLGGYTGSGKTEALQKLMEMGEQVLDLEALASHKGSAFGDIGQGRQPTNEQFENDVYHHLQRLDRTRPIWVEDESRSIGTVSIPDPFFLAMKESPLFFVDIEKSARMLKLVTDYTACDPGLLINATLKIAEKLGGQNTKLALEALDKKDFPKAVALVLDYYDKAYLAGIMKRSPEKVVTLKMASPDTGAIASKLTGLSLSIQPANGNYR